MDRWGFLAARGGRSGSALEVPESTSGPGGITIDGVDYPSSVPSRDDLSVSVRVANVDCLRRPIM